MKQKQELPSGWEKTTLGKVAKFGSGATKPLDISENNGDGKHPVYGGNGIIGYSSEFNSEGPEIIIGRVGEKCGCVHVSEVSCWVTDNALRIKDRYAEIYRHIFQVSTSSSVDRRGSLRWGDFSKIKVLIPSLEEQQQISEILSSSKHEIDLLKQLAEKYKIQKRGLMQKMLAGEWRVKPEIVNQYMEA